MYHLTRFISIDRVPWVMVSTQLTWLDGKQHSVLVPSNGLSQTGFTRHKNKL